MKSSIDDVLSVAIARSSAVRRARQSFFHDEALREADLSRSAASLDSCPVSDDTIAVFLEQFCEFALKSIRASPAHRHDLSAGLVVHRGGDCVSDRISGTTQRVGAKMAATLCGLAADVAE
jgi:hypothetical protein